MAADTRLTERVYSEIKRRIQAGEFRLRQRLDVAYLARVLSASATPVREALTRLAAERVIIARPARGFFVHLWSEAELEALYQWRGVLVQLSLQSASEQTQPFILGERSRYAERVSGLLQLIERAANPEIRRAGANADDRLYLARQIEVELMPHAEAELAALEQAATAGRKRVLISGLRLYHRRRVEHARVIRERAAVRSLRNGE